MAVNLIRKNNSDAITAAMDAAMYYMMIGEGVFSGTYSSCEASITNGILTIQPGLISIGGRIVEIPENNPVKLEIDQYGKNNPFYIKINVTIEDDDSQSTATIYASVETTQSDRHALTGTSTYTTNLFRIAYSTSTASYTITRTLSLIEPGVASNATSLLASGKIGDTLVTDIFEMSSSSVTKIKKCKEAEIADEAEGFAYLDNGSGKNLNEVTSALYMPQRGVYVCIDSILLNQVIVSNTKQADYSVAIDNDTTAIDIPFEDGASLGSISRYALARIKVTGGTGDTILYPELVAPAECIQNGDSIPFVETTYGNTKYEVKIDKANRKVRIRFQEIYHQVTVSLHIVGIGVA